MSLRIIAVLACVTLAACTVTPPPSTAQLSPGTFGLFDNDVAAINLASSAFASPSRTRNNPADAARACAAIDYLAGELSSNPRWITVSPLTRQEMLRARADMRRVLGIAPDAPSQAVVDALLQFAAAWQAANQQAALQALAVSGFTLPPPQTLLVLTNLPEIRSANIASIDAAIQMYREAMLSGGNIDRSS
jgi:hypothetical protein